MPDHIRGTYTLTDDSLGSSQTSGLLHPCRKSTSSTTTRFHCPGTMPDLWLCVEPAGRPSPQGSADSTISVAVVLLVPQRLMDEERSLFRVKTCLLHRAGQ